MSNRAERRRAAKRAPAPAPVVAATTTATAEREALVVTHYFNAGDLEDNTTIRLTGKQIDGPGTFSQEDQVIGIATSVGPVAVTSWVYGLEPGDWAVTATIAGRSARIARWSWRHWSLSPAGGAPVRTRWAALAPLAAVPGVIPGIWPLLGAVAIVLAIVVQRLMLPHEGVAVEVPLAVPLVALGAGLAGAKIWYALLHPGPWRQALIGGWAVDGFLLVAPLVAVLALAVIRLPVGAFLDAVMPGVFLAVAVGRVGCFFAGCCAGRVTGSRLGLWSSDRKVMARRIPTQILESAAGLAISGIAIVVILGHVPRVDGVIFLASLAAYFLVRQSLLRLRAERREFLWRRSPTTSRA
jgi:phosphatidylglycerol---prolipoprotein diacylglyceryl transferase